MHTRLPQQRCLLPSRLLARTQSQTNRMTRRNSRPAGAMTQRRTRRALQLGEPMGKQRTCIQNSALDRCEWLPHMQHRGTMGPNSVPHGPVALRSMRHSTGLTPIWRSCMRERGGSKVSSDETDSTAINFIGKPMHVCGLQQPPCMHARGLGRAIALRIPGGGTCLVQTRAHCCTPVCAVARRRRKGRCRPSASTCPTASMKYVSRA